MNKIIHIIVLLILFAIIFYLAKELYNNYNKEIFSSLGQNINEQGLTGGNNYKFDSSKKYEDIISNLDVQFHDDFTSEKDDYGLPQGTAYTIDKDGKRVALPPTGLKTPVTYFKPQDYIYGSLSYVPNYEDSVFLSRTANMYIGEPIVETASIKAGICNYYKNNPDQLEQACQHTDPNICASTSCCVLLGGAKCVSGSENGPIMKSHYSNTSIPNRDFYYFQSKCYGNCPRQ
jgi:hypothetical protein